MWRSQGKRARRGRVVYAALAGLVAVIGCGAETEPAAVRSGLALPVLVDGTMRSPWAVDVPVPEGWQFVRDAEASVAALSRPFAPECELFVQLTTRGSTEALGRPESRGGLTSVERGRRSIQVRLPDGQERYSVGFRVLAAGGLAFGGGATGPGGRVTVRFEPDGAPWRTTPSVELVAQGGTEGPGCFSIPLDRAPTLVLRALGVIGRETTLVRDG